MVARRDPRRRQADRRSDVGGSQAGGDQVSAHQQLRACLALSRKLLRSGEPLSFGMDDSLYFTEQHLAVRNMVREFARSEDRKSTRLNSSHSSISYAVFCLKKKTYI